MTLTQHLSSADYAWRRIDTAMQTPVPFTSETRDTLRDSARKAFWLYPLIEARRGLPGA